MTARAVGQREVGSGAPAAERGQTIALVASPKDFLALCKPGITGMAVFMAAGALLLAPSRPPAVTSLLALAGIALLVASANAFNMFAERETDGLMERTRLRPLPDGRMRPSASLAFAIGTGALSMALLWVFANPLTVELGAVALVLYVLVYTPLKRRTSAALMVGAVPGAMPALMGWTAATGRIEPVGLALFLILFIWQIPHFLAISTFRRTEYERAGIHVVPTTRGEAATRRETLAWSGAMVPLSLALVPLEFAGWLYVVVAALAGGTLVALAASRGRGATPEAAACAWARRYFRATLVYLPALILGLVLDRAWR